MNVNWGPHLGGDSSVHQPMFNSIPRSIGLKLGPTGCLLGVRGDVSPPCPPQKSRPAVLPVADEPAEWKLAH